MFLECDQERMQDFGVETPFPLGSPRTDARIKKNGSLKETVFDER
jgi:hypothetical protein